MMAKSLNGLYGRIAEEIRAVVEDPNRQLPLTADQKTLYVSIKHTQLLDQMGEHILELADNLRVGFQTLTAAQERTAIARNEQNRIVSQKLDELIKTTKSLKQEKKNAWLNIKTVAPVMFAAGVAAKEWGWEILKILIVAK